MINIMLRRRKLGRGSTQGIKHASSTGLKPRRNDSRKWPKDVKYVFRWGCTSEVPEGAVVVNTAAAIHWCGDKRQGRMDMQAAGVAVPRTWGDPAQFEPEIGTTVPSNERFVVRPSRHAQGRNIFVGGWQDSVTAWHRFGGGYISVFVDKVAEYRVAVIQGRVAWVAQKTPGNPEDVAWNVARGGRFDNVKWTDWPMLVVKEALKAAKVSGTDFCGVDIMTDIAGTPYVLEVNSAPSQTSPYRQQCFAKCFDYIVANGKEHFPEVKWSPRTTWKSTIHPAVKPE